MKVRNIVMAALVMALVAATMSPAVAQKKKKRPKPKPPAPPVCAPYAPAEAAKDAQLVVVTDEATEEQPLSVQLTTQRGLPRAAGAQPDTRSHNYLNIQVDTANPDAGLWVFMDHAAYRDYDLYLQTAEGKTMARSAGLAPVGALNDNQNGGESGVGTERLRGVRTADCGGWTLDAVGYLTEGGSRTLTLWLGEVQWEPKEV